MLTPDEIEAVVLGARWVAPENYHLTLRFIGDIDDVLAREIAYMLGKGYERVRGRDVRVASNDLGRAVLALSRSGRSSRRYG